MMRTVGPRAEFQTEAPRPGRLASIGEALEEVLGAYASRSMQAARANARPSYSPVALDGAGAMSACGSLSTR
jgi:hypothetical protein